MIFSEGFSEKERDHFFDVIFKLYPEFIPNYNKMFESVIKQLKKYGGVID